MTQTCFRQRKLPKYHDRQIEISSHIKKVTKRFRQRKLPKNQYTIYVVL